MSLSRFLFVRLTALALVPALSLASRALDTSDPVGDYRLATVNGSRVPMTWHRVELPAGGVLQLAWVGGRAHVDRDGGVMVVVTTTVTGPGTPGTPSADTVRGRWLRGPRGEVEIRFHDGRRTRWPATDGYRSLTIRAMHADLDGERRPITLVLVRQ